MKRIYLNTLFINLIIKSMNKKFFTLMVGALLAVNTGVFAVDEYKTLPAGTAAETENIADGSIVRLQLGANATVFDLNGANGATAKMDSLIVGDAAVTGRSKAHVDSLLFEVGYKVVKKIYGSEVGTENTFTFSNSKVKLAFAKPETGKVANAFVKADGAINEWILPAAYLNTGAANKGYAPYAIATRTSADDATPLTVYVLATLNAETDGNASGTVQIVEVGYDKILEAEIDAENNLNIAYDKSTGKATLEKSAAGAGTTHTLVTISGFSVAATAMTFDVASADVEAVLGYETPSFSFNESVSEGEENPLIAYNWEYTSDGYLKAVDAKLPATKAAAAINDQLYLTVDTMCYDEANHQYFQLVLDTLPAMTSTKPIRNENLYKFDIKANFGSDSISIVPRYIPEYKDGKFVDVNGKINEKVVTSVTNVQAIAIKTFAGKKVLTVLPDGDVTPATKIVAVEEAKGVADDALQFTEGDVYLMRDMNKVKDGKVNENYGKYFIINNLNDRSTVVKVATVNNTLPSHQWVVQKEAKGYKLVNRETLTAQFTSRFFDDSKVKGQIVSGTDTIKLDKIAASKLSPFDGYREISKADQMNKKYVLRFNSELLGENAYVQQGTDSVMAVAIDNEDSAIEVRFLQMDNDTIKLGVGLTAVPYTVKYGRYFMKYDADKKVYRFTQKQVGEAYGEAEESYDKFLITKLADGNVALVPVGNGSALTGNDSDLEGMKVAIDSKNGNAVKVVLNSDLRHSFTIQEPKAPIFAQVLPKADSTLVDITLHSVENLGWKVAKGEDHFLYEGVPALKAGGAEYDKAAFNFKLDTAYVNRTGNTMPLYYITYNATRGDSIPVTHVHDNGKDHVCPAPLPNDTVSGQFLFIMEDSLGISREKDLEYGYTYNPDEYYAKLQFVNAKHIGENDKLIVNPGRVTPLSMDTLYAGEVKANARPEEIQTQWLGDNENKALFAFRINLDNKDEYALYNPATNKYISYLNGFLVATSDFAASFYTLTDPNGGSVDNEKIEDSVSAISVTAKVGAVEIAGAAGKRVVISNVLGQVVANTIITSDNATIAASEGVVVVAVEGESAVKAIVK